MCLSVFILGFILFGTLCFLDLVDYLFSHVREVFIYYLFKYFPESFLSIFSFWDPYNTNVGVFKVVLEVFYAVLCFVLFFFFLIILFNFFSFIFISWRLITLQYCSGFCHTLTWISHGFTCIPHPDPPSHLPLYLIPLGLPSAPGPSTCLLHPTWAGDLFPPR